MSPIFLPPRFTRSKRCARCGHWYDHKQAECTHCHRLTDAQAQQTRQQISERKLADRPLGSLFLFIAILLLVAVLLAIVLG